MIAKFGYTNCYGQTFIDLKVMIVLFTYILQYSYSFKESIQYVGSIGNITLKITKLGIIQHTKTTFFSYIRIKFFNAHLNLVALLNFNSIQSKNETFSFAKCIVEREQMF